MLAVFSCDNVLERGCQSKLVQGLKGGLSGIDNVKNVSESEESVAAIKIY